MSKLDKKGLDQLARNLGFNRDILEKSHRLNSILKYFNTETKLNDNLALKGGTAINFTIFDLPRLSVDIDLDYTKAVSKEIMMAERKVINAVIEGYMQTSGYVRSAKSKNHHSLDSSVYEYVNSVGNKDNIKIDINYSLRTHVLPIEKRTIMSDVLSVKYEIRTLHELEIFGSKIKAMLDRAAARDLYDVANLVKFRQFDENEKEILKKCVIFYSAITASDASNIGFDVGVIDSLSKKNIHDNLYPVIHKNDGFNLEEAKMMVKDFVGNLMLLNDNEKEFLRRFANKEYEPKLLFQDGAIVERIINHPMALWKIKSEEFSIACFVPLPRKDKAETAEDEYNYHVTRFERVTGGKVNEEIEGRIAKAMVQQGYDEKEIASVIGKQSPNRPNLSDKAREYGNSILKEAVKLIKQEMKGNNQGSGR